jgi:hypothetical protein
MAYAARVMRGLIIDYARNRQAQKRGGQFEITSIRTDIAESIPDAADLVPLSDALDELAAADTRLARIVDLKFFCGFLVCGDSDYGRPGADHRDWQKARIYLHQVLQRHTLADKVFDRRFRFTDRAGSP